MKAAVYEKYGPPAVLELCDVERPVPGPADVLVKVHASAIGAGDWIMLTAPFFAVRLYQGVFSPKRRTLGHDVAGVVEAVGSKVTRFTAGDEVYGECNAGGFAEYVAVPEKRLAHKPASLSLEEAAALPVSALTALQGLRDRGRIRAGQKVLINGASGGVGGYAVQIAKAYDTEVTGTCRHAKADYVRSLGADHVLDYESEDFTQREERYDVILDMAGKQSIAGCKRCLTSEGVYVAAAGAISRSMRIAVFGGQRMVGHLARPNAADLEVLTDLVEAGRLRPVVDACYPLAEIVAAMRRFGEREVCGKLVIAVP